MQQKSLQPIISLSYLDGIKEAAQQSFETMRRIQSFLEPFNTLQNRTEEAIKPLLNVHAQVQKSIFMLTKPLQSLERTIQVFKDQQEGLSVALTNASDLLIKVPQTPHSLFEDPIIIEAVRRPVIKEFNPEYIADLVAIRIEEKFIAQTQKNASSEKMTDAAIVDIPTGAIWEKIKLVVHEHRTITVYYNNKIVGKYDNAQLGLVRLNTKTNQPDKQWSLLLQLSVLAGFKEIKNIPAATIHELATCLKTSPGALQQIKRNLARKLQRAFGISESPFYSYSEKGYQLKCELAPDPLLQGSGELHRSAGVLYENSKSYLPD